MQHSEKINVANVVKETQDYQINGLQLLHGCWRRWLQIVIRNTKTTQFRHRHETFRLLRKEYFENMPAIQSILCLLYIPRFTAAFVNSLPLGPIMNQLNPVNTLVYCFLEVHFNIILSFPHR
jgi:hypothetical protein